MAAIHDVLRFYVRAQLAGKALLPHPTEILSFLEGQAGYLAVGQIPRTIAEAASEGRRTPGPSERLHIGRGVAYIRAAKGGLKHLGEWIVIDDKLPIKTVAEAFGVNEKTVHGWKNQFKPASPNIGRADGDLVASLMRKAGENYQKAGRSIAAIQSRGRLRN